MTVIDSPCINSYSRCTYCCLFYNNTGRGGAEYCDESVCLSACMSASYIYETTRPNFTEESAVAVHGTIAVYGTKVCRYNWRSAGSLG